MQAPRNKQPALQNTLDELPNSDITTAPYAKPPQLRLAIDLRTALYVLF